MEVNGLPLHALVLHAAVVLVPLAALTAVVFAVVPRWRWALRWPFLAGSLAATVAVVAAYFSGRDYLDANPGLQRSPAVALHEERAEVLLWLALAYAVVAVAAALLLPGPTALASGAGGRVSRSRALDVGLALVLVVLAVWVLVQVVLVGDAGTRSKWGG